MSEVDPFKYARGTVRVFGTEDVSISKELEIVKIKVARISTVLDVMLLLHCEMRGNGWTIRWWPANQPRHEITDEIVVPYGS